MSSNKKAPKRLDAYVRVSQVKKREGETFTSPSDQEKRIRAWAQSQGHVITNDGPSGDGAWHELDVSGGTMDRPMLNEILARIETGESDGIVVYSLDRFGRTLIKALEIIERLHEDGKVFASVSDSFDISTDTGRLVLRMMLSIAQYERERIKTRWEGIKANAVLNRNIHVSAQVPFGYQREEHFKSTGEKYLGKLIPHPDEAPLVAEIFRRRAAGESWGTISTWINEIGATPRRSGSWSVSTVQGMVDNRVYLGEARGGVLGRNGVGGTPANVGAHEPLIDHATWLAAQRGTALRTKAPRGTRHQALGMGLVRCAQCRYVTAVIDQPKAEGAFNYVCDRSWRGQDCQRPALIASAVRPSGAPTIDDVIAEQVLVRLDAEPSGFQKVEDTGVDIPGMEAELEDAIARARACGVDFALEERIGTLAWEARCVALDEHVQSLAAELAEVRHEQLAEPVLGRTAHDIADDWRNDRLSIDEKREVVAGLVQAIFVRRSEDGRKWSGRLPAAKFPAYMDALRSRVHIVWVGDPEVEVPRQGRRYSAKPFQFPRG